MGNLNLTAGYSLADAGMFINAPSPMIVPANKFILAILNSKLADYYIRNLGVARNGGYFEYKPMFIEKLPVPKLSLKQQEYIELLVDSLLATRKLESNVSAIKQKIDDLIFNIYGLNKEEVTFVNQLSN